MSDGSVLGGDANRALKSPDAFRTISEVATDLDLPQHVLRFWEQKFPQLKPMKRGGGRRYYRADDVQLLKRIRGLLYEDGYTIKGVQKLMRQCGSLRNFIGGDAAEEIPETPLRAPRPVTVSSAAWRGEMQAVLDDLKALRAELTGAG
ncbi:MAG: MerR family transcriptional regulator [Proteobacteria bacterium]|nr:MerR family transcriptional regulator [Pseudomonadota bacterium]